MKKIGFLYIFLLTVSCNMMESTDVLEEELTTGQDATTDAWTIALFIEDGYDITRNFAGISFQFNDRGELLAQKDDELVRGSWRIERDTPRDELYILFPRAFLLSELNDDWYIRERNETFISLEYPDDDGIDQLVFVREGNQRTISKPYESKKEPMEQLFSEVSNGSFDIARLIDDDKDKTGLFDGGTLAFAPLGKVLLTVPGSSPWEGSWKIGFNNQRILLDIDFTSQGIPDYLDEDWRLTAQTGSIISFEENDQRPDDFLNLKKR